MTEEKTIELLNDAVLELRNVALRHLHAAGITNAEESKEFMQNIFLNFFAYMMAQNLHGTVPKKKRNEFMNQAFMQLRGKINFAVEQYDKESSTQSAEATTAIH